MLIVTNKHSQGVGRSCPRGWTDLGMCPFGPITVAEGLRGCKERVSSSFDETVDVVEGASSRGL